MTPEHAKYMKPYSKQKVNVSEMYRNAPTCPLCLKHRMRVDFREDRGLFVYVCDLDKIVIRVDDPFCGRWEEAVHKQTDGQGIPCPVKEVTGCDAKARYFCTTAGYMRSRCPKCHAEFGTKEMDKDIPKEAPPKEGTA